MSELLQASPRSDSDSNEETPSAPDAAAASFASSSTSAAAATSAPAPSAASPFVRAPPNAYVRVKPGNFSRLLYTNPVCLLTTSRPAAAASVATAPVASEAVSASDFASSSSAASVDAASSSDAAAAPAASSASAPSAPAAAFLPSRNVMTISWLTATSNHGEFVASMHAGRCSARMLAAQVAENTGAESSGNGSGSSAGPVGGVFVLSVPVAGMESLVKSIGGCSGSDAPDVGQPFADKFTRLGIKPCRPGNKPVQTAAPFTAAATAGGKARPSAAQLDEIAADVEDHSLDLLAIPGCAAHLVCRVVSACPAVEQPTPRVQAHNVLFCVVTRAYVHRDYFINGNNFVAAHAGVPPYLTFLGSGNFGHVVLPSKA